MKFSDFANNSAPPVAVCSRGALVRPFVVIIVWMCGWHFSRALIDRVVTKRSWNRLASYAIGVVVSWPGVALMLRCIWKARGLDSAQIDALLVDVFAGYFGAYLAGGFGTAIGWAVWDGR